MHSQQAPARGAQDGAVAPLRPRIRVRAGSTPNSYQVVGPIQRPFQSGASKVDDPLGSGEAYEGEIFGVTNKRKPVILVPASAKPHKTLVILDSHFHPGLIRETTHVMKLVGHHAAAIQPDQVVHIGDGSDWAFACRHTRNDTWKARLKPTARQDLNCFRENWDVLNTVMDAGGVTPHRHYCWGNHDAWIHTYEDDHPEIHGMISGEFRAMLEGWGWSQSDYGEYAWVGGVAYVHVPLNLMGRPVGGQTAENTIAMQSTSDTVFGHTHRKNVVSRVKMDGTIVTVANGGSTMPERYVGEYAQLSMGRKIDYGVMEITACDGRILQAQHVPMKLLQARYGHLVH